MTEKTNKYIKEMGQTGAGLQHEDEINMESNSALANKWGKHTELPRNRIHPHVLTAVIKAECPWFFEMRALIAERPNTVPVGLGSSNSAIDPSILLEPKEPEEDEEDSKPEAVLKAEVKPEVIVDDPTFGMDAAVPSKRKGGEERDGGKKKGKLSEFAMLVEADAKTRNKEINLAKAKVDARALIKVEANKAALSAKVELEKAKVEHAKMKLQMKQEVRLAEMKYKHELEMARIQAQGMQHSQPYHSHGHDLSLNRSSSPGFDFDTPTLPSNTNVDMYGNPFSNEME
jgi:hypothetical protein